MKVTEALKTEVLNVLAEMAVEGQLDGDINSLDIDTVFEKAEQNLKDDKETFTAASWKSHSIESLGDYLSGGENLRDSYNILKKAQAEGNGRDMADNYVTMVQLYEDTFTVNQLLEEVEP